MLATGKVVGRVARGPGRSGWSTALPRRLGSRLRLAAQVRACSFSSAVFLPVHPASRIWLPTAVLSVSRWECAGGTIDQVLADIIKRGASQDMIRVVR